MNSFDSTEQPRTTPRIYHQLKPSTIESSRFPPTRLRKEREDEGDGDKRQHLKTNDLKAGDTVLFANQRKTNYTRRLIPNPS